MPLCSVIGFNLARSNTIVLLLLLPRSARASACRAIWHSAKPDILIHGHHGVRLIVLPSAAKLELSCCAVGSPQPQSRSDTTSPESLRVNHTWPIGPLLLLKSHCRHSELSLGATAGCYSGSARVRADHVAPAVLLTRHGHGRSTL